LKLKPKAITQLLMGDSDSQILLIMTLFSDWQKCPRHETRHFICVKLVRLYRTSCCHLLWLES